MINYVFLLRAFNEKTIISLITFTLVAIFIVLLAIFLILDYRNTKANDFRNMLYRNSQKSPKHEVLTVYSDKSKNFSGTEILPIPVKNSTKEYNYEFAGWDKNYFNESGDMVVRAIFIKRHNNFVVNFYSDDKSTLLKTAMVEYGSSVDVSDLKPVKEETNEFSFEFVGWSKDASNIQADENIYAVFKAYPKKYTYTFFDSDRETVLFQETAIYGTPVIMPAKPVSQDDSLKFSHWENYVYEMPLKKDENFYAVYREKNVNNDVELNGNLDVNETSIPQTEEDKDNGVNSDSDLVNSLDNDNFNVTTNEDLQTKEIHETESETNQEIETETANLIQTEIEENESDLTFSEISEDELNNSSLNVSESESEDNDGNEPDNFSELFENEDNLDDNSNEILSEEKDELLSFIDELTKESEDNLDLDDNLDIEDENGEEIVENTVEVETTDVIKLQEIIENNLEIPSNLESEENVFEEYFIGDEMYEEISNSEDDMEIVSAENLSDNINETENQINNSENKFHIIQNGFINQKITEDSEVIDKNEVNNSNNNIRSNISVSRNRPLVDVNKNSSKGNNSQKLNQNNEPLYGLAGIMNPKMMIQNGYTSSLANNDVKYSNNNRVTAKSNQPERNAYSKINKTEKIVYNNVTINNNNNLDSKKFNVGNKTENKTQNVLFNNRRVINNQEILEAVEISKNNEHITMNSQNINRFAKPTETQSNRDDSLIEGEILPKISVISTQRKTDANRKLSNKTNSTASSVKVMQNNIKVNGVIINGLVDDDISENVDNKVNKSVPISEDDDNGFLGTIMVNHRKKK